MKLAHFPSKHAYMLKKERDFFGVFIFVDSVSVWTQPHDILPPLIFWTEKMTPSKTSVFIVNCVQYLIWTSNLYMLHLCKNYTHTYTYIFIFLYISCNSKINIIFLFVLLLIVCQKCLCEMLHYIDYSSAN